MPPHLWSRQIVSAAVNAPHTALHLGIECEPIGSIAPLARHSRCRTLPALTRIFAAKQAYVGIGKKPAGRLERIELNTVNGRHIQTSTRPFSAGDLVRIDCRPGSAAISGLHCPAEVGGVGEIGIMFRNPNLKRVFTPVNAEPWRDPVVMDIRCWCICLFPD